MSEGLGIVCKVVAIIPGMSLIVSESVLCCLLELDVVLPVDVVVDFLFLPLVEWAALLDNLRVFVWHDDLIALDSLTFFLVSVI